MHPGSRRSSIVDGVEEEGATMTVSTRDLTVLCRSGRDGNSTAWPGERLTGGGDVRREVVQS
jgi:hypothetical protein